MSNHSSYHCKRTMVTCRRFVGLFLCVLLWTFGSTLLPSTFAAETTTAEVRELIQKLGDDSYATRTRAKERLKQLGLEAFDELHKAQFDPDNEISMSARFLVNSLLVSWSKDGDPPEVTQALAEYGAQDINERRSRIAMLADFPRRAGLTALTRLVRFETKLRLSRQAAIAAMEQPISEDAAVRRRNAERVLTTLGDNDRQGAKWLRVYAEDLMSGSYSASRWRNLIAQQRDEVDAEATEQSDRKSVLELVRICAVRAAQTGMRDEAIQLASDNIDLISPTTRDLRDACSWAIDNDLHPFVLNLRKTNTHMFSGDAFLLYNAAEAFRRGDEGDVAEKLAAQALAIRPLPTTEDEKSKLRPRALQELAESHRLVAMGLAERGLFDWAEREFRRIIDAVEINSGLSARSRDELAWMLGELNRHQDVIDLLKPLVERASKDDDLQKLLINGSIPQYKIRGLMNFHAGQLALNNGNKEEARKLLYEGYKNFRENVDILIAMYRLDGNEDWTQTVKFELRKAILNASSNVAKYEGEEKTRGRLAAKELATAYNQYAWLVSNTEGKYDLALEYSKRSLELHTDFMNLDTCARCYYALGDFQNAVHMRRRALKLQPHSPPLRRQLAEFEAALKTQLEAEAKRNQAGASSSTSET